MHKNPTRGTRVQSLTKRPFTRRDFLSTSLKAGAAAFTTGLLPKRHVNAEGQYNVLFIIVDDLRTLLGCYGHPEMHTPNIDRIAERGRLFDHAYCQVPLCNPSRVSMLTGLRPARTGVLQNSSTDFRDKLPDVVTLPQYFKAHGYYTQAVGKVTHDIAHADDVFSWSVPSWAPPKFPFSYATNPVWKALDVADDTLDDGKIANRAVEVLKDIKGNPFFLAVGFNKPHLPFHVPRKYFEFYDRETFNLPISSSYPQNSPRFRNSLGLLTRYQDILSRNVPLSDEKTLELIWAYAASTSYMDAQVGRVLDQLDALGLTENTVITFCGDHGFHLGEHGKWRKNTLFEVSLRSPMIISVPGQKPSQTDALAELVDIYPTLCEACELPVPSELEALSLMPVITQPRCPWKTAAFSQLGIGGTMRTNQYRYTEWGNKGKGGRELYDYYADPDETVNIVDYPENQELVAQLSEQLHAGWRAALPDMQEQIPVPQTSPWDINNDGIVDIQDLVLISNSFDTEAPEHPKVDVNRDGSVDIIDLLVVAAHFGESSNAGAPPTRVKVQPEHLSLVDEWLTEAYLVDDGSDIFQRGITTLELLINTAVPTETALLSNYPNPFNPETWIPYDLAQDADIHIHIYNLKGQFIRQLSLGFQTAGTYRTRTRAAYWDGRNAAGELVASRKWSLFLHASGGTSQNYTPNGYYKIE